jgi:hypothetical protein
MQDEDVGLYTGNNYWGFPEYDETHEYTIVLEITSSNPRTINFGFLDGGLSDNHGQVNISLTPVQTIPEPNSMALLLVGGVAIVAFLRRMQ